MRGRKNHDIKKQVFFFHFPLCAFYLNRKPVQVLEQKILVRQENKIKKKPENVYELLICTLHKLKLYWYTLCNINYGNHNGS